MPEGHAYAGVGLTEAGARAGHDCAVTTVPYDFVTRALIDGLPAGFCKLIADRQTGRLFGGHVVGAYSAEVIQVVAVCLETGLRLDRVAELQLAYPTIAQGVVMAAGKLEGDLQLDAGESAWDPVASARPSIPRSALKIGARVQPAPGGAWREKSRFHPARIVDTSDAGLAANC